MVNRDKSSGVCSALIHDAPLQHHDLKVHKVPKAQGTVPAPPIASLELESTSVTALVSSPSPVQYSPSYVSSVNHDFV